jgi:ABC-2 type transport system ATP-binding protein
MTPTPARPVLDVRSLGKSYGNRAALGDVSLSLPASRFALLLGPNGAGKTTLFQVLTGLFNVEDTCVPT